MSTNWIPRTLLSGPYRGINLTGPLAATQATLALSTGYVYATSGSAYCWSFVPQVTGNLTDIYVNVSSYTGTWASTDGVIDFEIREGLNGSRIPGTTLTGSGTITLNGSTTGWVSKSGLSIALTAGKLYTIIIYDSDGGGTNFVTMVKGATSTASGVSAGAEYGTTANGFSSAYTQTSGAGAFVLTIGSITIAGGTFSAISTVTSGTYERGMRFQPDDDCSLIGAFFQQDQSMLASATVFKLYADATAAGGSTLASYTLPGYTVSGGTTPTHSGIIFPSASRYDLTSGTWYRFVVLPASALTVPRKATIGGSPDSTVLSASMPFSGNCYWTQDNSGSWVDDTASMCQMGPILVPRSASGGAAGRRNMRGNFIN